MEKKLAVESTCPPHFSIILITMAEIKGNMLYNDRCLLSGATVLLLFVSLWPRRARLDGRKTLVFESSSRRWMWALGRGTALSAWFYAAWFHSHHMSLEVVFWRPRVLICAMSQHTWGGCLVICVLKRGLDLSDLCLQISFFCSGNRSR